VCREAAPGGQPFLKIQTSFDSTDPQTRFEGNTKVRFTFQGQSVETDSKPICIQINWDGKWHDDTDKMLNSLVFEKVTSPS